MMKSFWLKTIYTENGSKAMTIFDPWTGTTVEVENDMTLTIKDGAIVRI